MADGEYFDIKSLLLRVAEGDEPAFRAVFDHYKSSFHAAAYKMTRSVVAAEEIVQEVFISLWSKRLLMDQARNPEAYLLRMLHNSIYTHFRKLVLEKRLRQKLIYYSGDTQENQVEELLLAKENRKFLDAVITQLPPQQQLIYRLSKQQGFSRDEIAGKLKISPHTVKNHLAAAIEFITAYFKKGASMLILPAFVQFVKYFFPH